MTAFQAFATPIPGVHGVIARTDHEFPRHTHDGFGIGAITAGAQRSASGRGPVEAAAGSVITVNPNEVHDGVPIRRQPRAWSMLYLTPRAMAAVTEMLTDGRRAEGAEFTDPHDDDPRRARAVLRAVAAARDPDTPKDQLMALLLPALAGLLGDRVDRARGRAAAAAIDRRAVDRALAAIDDDPAGTLDLAALAGIAGIGRGRLIRDMATVTGLTPHAYRVQRRLDLARHLLATGEAVAGAAALAGFADQAHLTRHFTKRYGITPARFAASLQA